jgi:glutaredoxin 2
LLVSAILVAVCTASLPQNDVQHLTDEIRQAENNLNGMMALENQEEAQMKAVGNSIEGLPNVGADNNDQQISDSLVQKVAKTVQNHAVQASSEEIDQERNAQAALTEVTEAAEELSAHLGQKKALGEGAGETPVQHALTKLKQVKSTLAQGSKTMHTKERLDRMATEAQAVKQFATGQPSSTQQQMSGGALSALKQLQPSLGESKEEGAISALQRANTPTTPTTSKVQQETQDLTKLLKQEKSVYAAEEADKSEIGSLIKNLD